MTVITSVTVQIDAPAPFVWDILVDYPNYPQWNPYTVSVTTTLAIGDPIDLTLPSPTGDGTFVNREFIRVVSRPHHLRYDTGSTYPGLLAIRDQWITVLAGDRCSYFTTDRFSGPQAGKVVEATGGWVQAGFDGIARALKVRAEGLWAGR